MENLALIQLIREGGLVVRAQAPWWSRAAAHLWPSARWEKAHGVVHISMAEVDGGEVGEFLGLRGADVEVCRFTGDRRYGRAEVITSPERAADNDQFPLVTRAPLLAPRASPL